MSHRPMRAVILALPLAFLAGLTAPVSAETAKAPEVKAEAKAPEAKAPEAKAAAKPAEDAVAAIVNGAEIHRSEVIEAQHRLPPQIQQLPEDDVYPLLLNRMIDSKLLAGQARKMNLQNDAEVRKLLASAEEQIIEKLYLKRVVLDQITDAALHKRYDEFRKTVPDQEEVKARHILTDSEAKAKEVIAELNKGAEFTELAKTKSTDQAAQVGGDLGFFKKGDMVAEFSDAAFKLKPGEITQTPVHTEFGWHVIKVEERRKAQPPSFEEAQEQLRVEMSQEMFAALVEKLRAEAKIQRFGLDGKPMAEPVAEKDGAKK